MSELLKKSQKYQAVEEKDIPKSQRPMFHMSAPVGWINDPNGWSVYKGEYHLFFQYHPYGTYWGPMHWGHMKTNDFIKWEMLPVAMAPDKEYDNKGCFSGSAMEDGDSHILMYTGVFEEDNNGTVHTYQAQCIAIGDGLHYTKLECNPVIVAADLPEGCNQQDFRDPKIWKDNGIYYAVMGSKDQNNDGQVVLFQSEDLKKWEYVNCVDQSNHQYGKMWECPDLFRLQGKDILLTSPQFMEAQGLEFHNGNGTLCIIGNLDEGLKLCRENLHAIDYGLDFYAPQTLETKDGRRIMIGWLQSWDNHITPVDFKWSGIMSIPRELTIQDGRLYQYPVREIEYYRSERCSYRDRLRCGNVYNQLMCGREFDMIIKLENAACDSFEIRLGVGDKKYTSIRYEIDRNLITFDRTYSGLCKDFVCERRMKVDEFHDGMEIRILMDKYSIEMFVDDGKYAMSSLIYTELSCNGIDFVTDGEIDIIVEKYKVCI